MMSIRSAQSEGELIAAVARDLRLYTKVDSDGTVIIPGKLGSMYEYDLAAGTIAAMFMPGNGKRGWAKRRDRLVTAGAVVVQNADNEGTVTIDAANKSLLKLAAKLVGIRAKKVLSPEQVEALKTRLVAARAKKGLQ